MTAISLVSSGLYFQWYVPEIKPLKEIVTEVNGRQFSMSYFLDSLNYHVSGYSQYASLFIEPVIENIQTAELIYNEAAKMGFTVSEEEIKAKAKELTAQNNDAVYDIAREQLLIDKLRAEYFDPMVPLSADQRYIMAMFLESESKVNELKEKIDSGESFGELAAEYSLDPATNNANGDLGFRPKGVLETLLYSSVIEPAVFDQEINTFGTIEDAEKSKQLGYWLVKVTERTESNSAVLVSGMLLSSEEEALAIKARLEGGEDFTVLAEQYSKAWDETNKDYLGKFDAESTAVYTEYVMDAAIPLNTVSHPIADTTRSTLGGFWLFKVTEASIQEIAQTDRDTLLNNLFTDWTEEIKTANEAGIVNHITEEMKTFAVSHVTA